MRKFDKYVIIRIIAVLLVMITLNFSIAHCYSLFYPYGNVNGNVIEDSVESLLSNKELNITDTATFRNAYYNFLNNLYTRIPMGDGGKEAYRTYTKKYEKNFKVINEYIAKENNISYSDGRIGVFQIVEWLNDGQISLQKLGNHDHTFFLKGNTSMEAYVLANEYYYSDEESNQIYIASNGVCYNMNGDAVGTGEVYINGDNVRTYTYDFDWDEGESTTAASFFDPSNSNSPIVSAAVENEKIRNDHVSTINIYGPIPDKIRNKAGDNAVIVQICNLIYGNKLYDGFYLLTFDSDFLASHYDTLRFFVFSKYNSYNEFKNDFNYSNKYFNDYSNFKYLVIDNQTKKTVCGNVSSFDEITSLNWYTKRDTKNGIIETSENYKDIVLDDIPTFYKSDEDYTIYVGLNTTLPEEDNLKEFMNQCEDFKITFNSVAKRVLTDMVILIAALILLIIFTGRRSYDEDIHMNFFDRIYTSLRWLIDLSLIAGSICLLVLWHTKGKFSGDNNLNLTYGWADILLTNVCALMICDITAFNTRHIKNHTFFKNFILAHIISAVKRKIIELKNRPVEYKDALKFVRKRIAIISIPVAILSFLAVTFLIDEDFELAILTIIPDVLLAIYALVYSIRYATGIRAIMNGVKDISNGNYDTKVNASVLTRAIRPYADNLNKVSDGVKQAVEEAVKQQNTKTELITNISHDLKTPLTSVINYVDLLKKTDITDEKALEYLDILGEKSNRLKRLIEDLVEASKATTGNIDVELIKMSFTELARQICGEYEDEMSSRGLELVSSIDNENINIMADSRMVYRVIDNLMNNARKYSMKGTRIYVNLERIGNVARFSIKNISSAPLNISVEELKQRFVRGDISRSTEGSGLGLSIANDFAELMNAKLKLNISGDMFEACVEFFII